MDTYTLDHFPPAVQTVHVAVFHNVRNAPEIRKRLIAAATAQGPEGDAARDQLDFGFIEGNMIVSRQHLMTAVQTTILDSLTPSGEIKTRSHNLHSEILLALSPNNNITDSIRRHGLSDATKELVVVRIEPGRPEEERVRRQAEVWAAIDGVVQGELVATAELDRGDRVDWSRVDKVYKLAEMNQLKLPKGELLERKRAAVVTTVAIKSVT